MDKEKIKAMRLAIKKAYADIDALTVEQVIEEWNKEQEKHRQNGYRCVEVDDNGYSSARYDALWRRYRQNDPDGEYVEEDEMFYPAMGWTDYNISGQEWLVAINKALNKIKGISCWGGTMYKNREIKESKIVWWITFDNVRTFNKFIWATCFRYFGITRNPNWQLLPDAGDPSFTEKKLKFCLNYIWNGETAEEMRNKVLDVAEGMEAYAKWLKEDGTVETIKDGKIIKVK